MILMSTNRMKQRESSLSQCQRHRLMKRQCRCPVLTWKDWQMNEYNSDSSKRWWICFKFRERSSIWWDWCSKSSRSFTGIVCGSLFRRMTCLKLFGWHFFRFSMIYRGRALTWNLTRKSLRIRLMSWQNRSMNSMSIDVWRHNKSGCWE